MLSLIASTYSYESSTPIGAGADGGLFSRDGIIERYYSAYDASKLVLRNADNLRFATWFHNAVYNPTRTDNEELSAALWRQFAAQCAADASQNAATTLSTPLPPPQLQWQ